MYGLTEGLIALVKRYEGWRAKAYLCPAGFPTIGYGHLLPTPPGVNVPAITEAQGEELLTKDLGRSQATAIALSPVLLRAKPAQAAAIIDFCYNVGGGRYRASTLRRKVNAGDWKAAARENAKWTRGGGRILPGLVARRAVTTKWLLP